MDGSFQLRLICVFAVSTGAPSPTSGVSVVCDVDVQYIIAHTLHLSTSLPPFVVALQVTESRNKHQICSSNDSLDFLNSARMVGTMLGRGEKVFLTD